jgi:hypothetical protein
MATGLGLDAEQWEGIMHKRTWGMVVAIVGLLSLLVTAAPADAGHKTDPHTSNLRPLGHIEEPASLLNPAVGNPNVHTDIAFQGTFAFQGSWLGFNIRDISSPGNPKPVSSTSCQGNQGDVIVFQDILVRSWNSPAGAGLECDGEPVPQGFEGLHVFDISDLSDPVLVGAVETECGSHTATGVPDVANGRLLVYNSSSSGACPGIDIVEVPLDNPGDAALVRVVGAGRSCHDTGVILGDAMLAGCAGGNGFTVFDLDTGDLANPQFLFSKNVNDEPEIDGVSIGHSAAFSFDGETLIFGHEPGGGVQARCQEGQPEIDRSAMFFDARTGDFQGLWTLPRTQGPTENCSIHNYNVVPTTKGDILVHGSYQSGTSVVDFTDRANAVELAFSDPPPIEPPDLGGAWSSYWYNNFIYETNITEGLNVFRFAGSETDGALQLDRLNPQTQTFTLP